jgi:L-asparaginase II
MRPRNPVIVDSSRGPIIENSHQVVYALVNLKGDVVDYHGSYDLVVTPRSSVKWLQAIPFVLSGAVEKFQLDETHIALACSSHKAQPHHLESLKKWMDKIKISEAALECGPALPTQSPISHNCSGKHLGFLSTALMANLELKGYTDELHGIQVLQKKIMTEIFGMDFFKIPHGGDGCGIPTFGVPLLKLATAMNYLVRNDISDAHKVAAIKILNAIKNFPEYVSGQQELSTLVTQITQGQCLLKTGADGIYTGLIPEKGSSFAVKCVDGNAKATELVCLSLFIKWAGLDPVMTEKLQKLAESDILDSRGQKVGLTRLRPGTV